MKQWKFKPWYKELWKKMKRLKPLFTKAFWKDVNVSVTVDIKNGWLQKVCGLIIFGSAWQTVVNGNAWYHWLLFVVGTLLGIHNIDKGYKKLYKEEKENGK